MPETEAVTGFALAWDRGQDLTVLFPADMVGDKEFVLFTGPEDNAENYERGFWDSRWAIRAQDFQCKPKADDPSYLQGWEFGRDLEAKKWGSLYDEED